MQRLAVMDPTRWHPKQWRSSGAKTAILASVLALSATVAVSGHLRSEPGGEPGSERSRNPEAVQSRQPGPLAPAGERVEYFLMQSFQSYLTGVREPAAKWLARAHEVVRSDSYDVTGPAAEAFEAARLRIERLLPLIGEGRIAPEVLMDNFSWIEQNLARAYQLRALNHFARQNYREAASQLAAAAALLEKALAWFSPRMPTPPAMAQAIEETRQVVAQLQAGAPGAYLDLGTAIERLGTALDRSESRIAAHVEERRSAF